MPLKLLPRRTVENVMRAYYKNRGSHFSSIFKVLSSTLQLWQLTVYKQYTLYALCTEYFISSSHEIRFSCPRNKGKCCFLTAYGDKLTEKTTKFHVSKCF